MTSNSYMDSIRSILGSVHRLLNAIKFRAKSDALICLPALLAMQVIDQTVQTQYVGTLFPQTNCTERMKVTNRRVWTFTSETKITINGDVHQQPVIVSILVERVWDHTLS